ncbi:iron-siderophore ABC transporter substrate-binding protein [Pseudomonas sp. PS1(2021)]|uniref:ABC transporter substrate-binding protein n=1 Tax=Pseudomonas sp. PS1(2021) TaxID=2866282 RepID=UPI001CEFD362|nr:iron-siderophore ABC transporter substrate-binding protein [Pseudomonas sp. PS1(2021)]UCM29512.1 iron-siderophore ABC transporter substrate-binding protein [Pseudomonas sp. PS1(2021)]
MIAALLSLPYRPKARVRRALFGGVLMACSAGAFANATLDTAFGPVTVHDHPQRVVSLGDNSLDAVLTLGVKPVGALASRGGSDIPNYLKAVSGALPLVGNVRAVNLEAVLAKRPDLILAGPDLTQEQFAKLSLIAPTIVPQGNVMSDWRGTLRTYAQALGKSAQAEQNLEQLDERIATLRKRLPTNLTLSVVRWNPQGPIMMSSHLFAGQLLDQLGIVANALAAQQTSRPHTDTLSLENLSKADADWIFLATLNTDGKQALAQARQQPAFTRLKASQAGHLASVDGQIWSSSSGYLAAQQVLKDVEKALAEQ